jgi:hypothetical protein
MPTPATAVDKENRAWQRRDPPRLALSEGRIVAEVMLGLMFGDTHSLLRMNPHWHPEPGPHYTLTDFVRYAWEVAEHFV